MKITNNDDMCVTCTLETPEGKSAFFMGREDHRHWTRSPETQELSNFVRDNAKFHQIFVQCGDAYTRVK